MRRPGQVRPTLLAVNPTGLFSGAERALVRLVDGARDAGWEVAVAAPDGPLPDHLTSVGLRRIRIPDLKLPDLPRPVAVPAAGMRALRGARALRRAAADVDLVLVNGLFALPALRLARLRPPVVWFVHDVIVRPDMRALLRAGAAAVDVAIAPSEAVARPLEAVGLEVRVVRNGTPWPVEPAAPESPPIVGASALLTSWKGQDVLLDAVARSARRDVVVELMGDTFPRDRAYAEQLRARAAAPDLAGRVRFLGHVDDPLDRMRRWTVAVSASVEPEAAPLNVLEAMSLGLPLVATDHGGTPEVLDGAGLLVPPRDVPAMARAITRLVDDRGLREECRAAGRRSIEGGLTLDANRGRLLAVLDDVAARSRDTGEVVFAVPDYVPIAGGTTRQVRNMAGELVSRGHRVAIVTRRRDRDWARRERLDGAEVERVGPVRAGRVGEKLGVLAVWARLWRHRRAAAIQVVMYPDFAVAAWGVGRASRTVMCWAGLGDATDTLAGHGGPAGLLPRLRRHALRRCRNVALAPAMQRELAGVGLGAEVVPLPVDLERFRPPAPAERASARRSLGLADDEVVFLHTGHLRRLKALDRLVDAFAGYRASGRRGRLFLVGGPSITADACAAELRAQVRRLGLGDGVVFPGVVDDVVRYLWAADVFVLPSEREGMPNSLAEAMACGLACVAPVQPVGTEVLGDAGLVPPDNEPESLLKAMIELADDPSERARLAEAARAVAGDWALGIVVDRFEQLYAGQAREP